MRKKIDQPTKKVSTIPYTTRNISGKDSTDRVKIDEEISSMEEKDGSISVESKPEQEKTTELEQKQASSLEAPTPDTITAAIGEKRPLEIRYQHHNLRSRLKKQKKAIQIEESAVSTSPSVKKEQAKITESPKVEKSEVKQEKKVKRWEAWSMEDTDDFFDALFEHGRDFDAIQRHIEKGHKKRGIPPEQSRNKDQVRHLYYRTCHKVFKFIEPRKDLNRNDGELHALINFGELRRKLSGVAMQKQKQKWRKLTELITCGATSVRLNGRNMRLKTPVCKALKALYVKDGKEPVKHVRPQKLPAKVTIDLRPHDNATWAAVQSMSYNPRIRMTVSLQKKISNLIKVLSSRMIRDAANLPPVAGDGDVPPPASNAEMIFKIPDGIHVRPYEDICGKYVLDNCRSPFTLKPEQIPAGYCRKRDLDKELETAVASEEGHLLPKSTRNEDSSTTNVSEKRPTSEVNLTASEDIISTTILPPSSHYTTSPLVFDTTSVFNGLASPSSLPTLAALNSEQGLKVNDTSQQRGALVKSQKTGTVVGSTIIVPSTEENSDFMNLTSISDVNILQTDEEEVAKGDARKEEETNKPLHSPKANPEELKTFRTKDDHVREGLTVSNSEHISLVDIYLMLGKPAKLGFVYEFVGEKSQKWKTNSMLTKLVMVARSEIDMAAEMSKKLVSVGTNTSPVKEAATTQLFRNPSQEIKIAYKADSSTPILTQNGQLTLRLNPGTTVDHMGQEKMKDFQFARPLAPAPIPVINTRLTNSTLATTDGGTVNLNQAPILLPKGRKRGRPAAVVGRILVPSSVSSKTTSQLFKEQYQSLHKGNVRLRPIMPNNRIIGKLVKAVPTVAISKSGVHDILSQAAICANITPSPPMRSDVGPSNTVVNSAQKTLVNNNNHDVIGLAPFTGHSTNTTMTTKPVISAQSAVTASTNVHQNPPTTEVSVLAERLAGMITSPSKFASGEPPMSPKPSLLTLDDLSGMSTPKASREGGLDRSLLNTPVIQDKHSSPTSTALNISPPNLSSLLDISLPSVEGTGSSQDGLLSGFRERLQELSVAAALSTTTVSVPKGGGQSPFKIGGGSQWLHEESSQNTEISLGSLLDQLEMTPEKKSTLSIPPPVVLADGSRDSVMSRDMDAHLQAMLNENSLDYVAKFADLAAHIAATGSEESDTATGVLQTEQSVAR
ncbi:protein cramped-like [Apostichopus japonicus]|uniref:protein cramped-like n=1 Tax=Stichopus japonicus TaxID=307972 RepID=UPI003AB32160